MSTFADLSNLPKAPGSREGLVPDAEPRFIGVLAEKWRAADEDEGDKPTALGTPFRHSDAGKCARYLSYVAAGIPASDPMDLSGYWNTRLGTLIHEAWQEALVARWPDAEIEPKVATVGADGSGHLDAVIRFYVDGRPEDRFEGEPPLRTIAYELKTIGGYGYKAAVGAARKGTPAEGPKDEHVLQAAINGLAVEADEIVIGYLAKESLSVTVAQRFGCSELERFCAEWTIPRSVYEPLAHDEAARVAAVLARVDRGDLAPRRMPSMPKGAEIVDPSTGAWTLEVDGQTIDTGKEWFCGYCSRQSLCVTTEPGIIPISSIGKAGEAA